MQKHNTKLKKGFSLIELIVVTAIIAIMTSVLLVTMTQGRATREVEAAGRGAAAAIRQAQNNALTGAIITSGCFPENFIFTATGSSYTVTVKQKPALDDENLDCGPQAINVHNLENNVSFDATSTLDELQFAVPFGGITTSDGGGEYADIAGMEQFVITKGDDASFYICVHPSGQIEESKVGC